MLREILTISGRPGLYKLVARGNNCLIVESLDGNGRRLPVQSTDKVVSLGDISIYTDDGEMRLREVFGKIEEKFGKNVLDVDFRKGSDADMNSFLADVIADYDRDRVHSSHIRKIVCWYNLLVTSGQNDFSESDEQGGQEEKPEEEKTE
ncbi:MAG: DUF5606 domain-containing protein [Bacteroidaceae bacterium]|nr:DUF5606 domain-containing protein [Bacteroidaceae bacterium]